MKKKRAPIFSDLLICNKPLQLLSYVPKAVRMGASQLILSFDEFCLQKLRSTHVITHDS